MLKKGLNFVIHFPIHPPNIFLYFYYCAFPENTQWMRVYFWLNQIHLPSFFSRHDSKSAGVCVMFKKGLDFVIHNSEIDRNGRYIILDKKVPSHSLTILLHYHP
jgi:hypothetical protein